MADIIAPNDPNKLFRLMPRIETPFLEAFNRRWGNKAVDLEQKPDGTWDLPAGNPLPSASVVENTRAVAEVPAPAFKPFKRTRTFP